MGAGAAVLEGAAEAGVLVGCFGEDDAAAGPPGGVRGPACVLDAAVPRNDLGQISSRGSQHS